MANKFNSTTAKLFAPFYSPEKLFSKIGEVAKSAGVNVIYAALLLYYALFDDEVPLKHKMIVIGALGYFILPADLIPDILPGGYADDLGALGLALKAIWDSISPATQSKAQQRLRSWFSNVKPEDLKIFKNK